MGANGGGSEDDPNMGTIKSEVESIVLGLDGDGDVEVLELINSGNRAGGCPWALGPSGATPCVGKEGHLCSTPSAAAGAAGGQP